MTIRTTLREAWDRLSAVPLISGSRELRRRAPGLFRIVKRLPRPIRHSIHLGRERLRDLAGGNRPCDFTVDGKTFTIIDSGRYSYYRVKLDGRLYEPALTARLVGLFKASRSATFVDVGAHFGYFSLLAAQFLDRTGRIMAVEPHPDYCERIRTNAALNGVADRVEAFAVAFGGREGHGQMMGWDHRELDDSAEGGIKIEPFDRFAEQHGINPDIVKIDVHGAEGKVLAGMPRTLTMASHVFVEMHDDMQGYNPRDLVAMLEQGGLTVREFVDHRSASGGRLLPLAEDLYKNPDDRVLYAAREIRS